MTFNERVNNIFVIGLKMSTFVPTKQHFQEVLLHCLLLRRMQLKVYLWRCIRHSKEWFQRFRSDDFNKKHEKGPKN